MLQLDNTLDVAFVLAASSALGHSPQTPQEDYQNPKSRCSARVSPLHCSLCICTRTSLFGGHTTSNVGKLVCSAC